MKILCLLLVTLVALASADFILQVSHQAPEQTGTVSVSVNGDKYLAFDLLSYGQFSTFINVTDSAFEDSDMFNLTVTSGIHELDSIETSLDSEYYNSLFIINSQDGELSLQVETDKFSQPEQYTAFWRVAYFSPLENEFVLKINGDKYDDFSYSSVSEYAQVIAGMYVFEIFSNDTATKPLLSEIFLLPTGTVSTVVFNGIATLTLTGELDYTYDDYTTCLFRAVHGIPNTSYNGLQVIAKGDGDSATLFTDFDYTDVTEFVTLEQGSYVIYFSSNGTTGPTTLQTTFTCLSSHLYTAVASGNPPLVDSEAYVVEDVQYAPLYTELDLNILDLSPSPAFSTAQVVIDQVPRGYASYNVPTTYYDVTSTTANVTLIGDATFYSTNLDQVSFENAYTMFLFGIVDSDQYPITSKVVLDFGTTQDVPTTTGSTTDYADDDDDDGLSGGAIAGIVIGVIVGVIILGGLGLFIVKRQRRSEFSTIG